VTVTSEAWADGCPETQAKEGSLRGACQRHRRANGRSERACFPNSPAAGLHEDFLVRVKVPEGRIREIQNPGDPACAEVTPVAPLVGGSVSSDIAGCAPPGCVIPGGRPG